MSEAAANPPPEPTRSRMTWVPLVAAAAVVAVVLLMILLLGSSHNDGFSLTSSRTIPSGHAAAAVVHEGDTVRAAGVVVAGPSGTARLCGPVGGASSPDGATRCRPAVALDGIAVARLTARRIESGRTVGEATVTGTYRAGRIAVTRQGGYASPDGNRYDAVPPCLAPDGGWPHGTSDPDLAPVGQYERRYPGAIVFHGILRPSRDQAVVYVITAGDPNPVGKALSPAFGKRLCVVRSSYSTGQITAARKLLTSHLGSALTDVISTGGPTVDGHGALHLTASVPVLTTSFARQVDAQPAGLIQLDVWLRPVG